MCWHKAIPWLLLAGNAFATEGYIIALGVEADTADGLAGALAGDVGLTEKTWLSGTLARNTVDLPFGNSVDTWYADAGIDHWFEPLGIRIGAAYWGDSDILESQDVPVALYWRNDKATLALNYIYRDFRFELPQTDFFQGRTFRFDANGVGLSGRVALTDSTSLGFSGMDYDYSVNLRLDRNAGLLDLLSFSRFSLINSLVDYRVIATLGVDAGRHHWELDLGTWKGEVDNGTTRTATLRFLTPIGATTDIEFGLGVDDSDLYGNVTFFSVLLYFYGGT